MSPCFGPNGSMNGSLFVFSSLSKGVTEKFVKTSGDSADSLYTHFPVEPKLLPVRRFSADNEGAAKRNSETKKKRHTKVCFYVLNICYYIRQLFGMEQHQKPWKKFLKKKHNLGFHWFAMHSHNRSNFCSFNAVNGNECWFFLLVSGLSHSACTAVR